MIIESISVCKRVVEERQCTPHQILILSWVVGVRVETGKCNGVGWVEMVTAYYIDEHVTLYRIRHVGNEIVHKGEASSGMQEGNGGSYLLVK